MLTKDGKDVDILAIDADNYKVPTGEEHLYHVKIEVKKFNADNGKRLSKPRIQIFGAKEYETTVKNDLIRQGYTLEVLHNPTEWLKEQEAAKAAAAEQTADDRKKAAEEKAAADAQAAAEAQQKAIDEAVAKALEKQAAENQKAIDKAVAAAVAKVGKTEKKADEPAK